MKQKKLVPKRRFEEFNDEWNNKIVGNISDSFSGGTPLAGNRLFYGGKIPFIRSGEINAKKTELSITDEGLKKSSAKLVEKGDVLYALYGATSGEVGISKINGAINQAILAIKPNHEVNSYFLTQWLKKQKKFIIETYLQGGQGNLSGNIVKQLMIDLPNAREEQQKIGQFFKHLDEMITLEQRKIDKTKALKSAYLAEMFPAEGERVPKRRFAGFTDDWEMESLGNIGQTFTGLSGKTKKDFGHGNAEFVTYLNVFNNPISNTNITDNVEIDLKQDEVKYGDVLFTTSSETPHEVGMSSVWLYDRPNVYLNSFCFGYRISIDVNYLFVAYILRSNLIRKQMQVLAQGISRYNISKRKVMEITILLPNQKEQQKIGSFFKKIDDTISNHQAKLDKLKATKQAYLHEMFV